MNARATPASAAVISPGITQNVLFRSRRAAADGEVDLAILAIAMPHMTGLQAAREMSRRAPEVRILMLSMYDNEGYFFAALKAEACGYVLKSVSDQDLVAACRAAMRGQPFLYAGAISALIRDHLARSSRQNGRHTGHDIGPRVASPAVTRATGSAWPEPARLP